MTKNQAIKLAKQIVRDDPKYIISGYHRHKRGKWSVARIYGGKSWKAMGKQFNMSREGMRQRYFRALEKLRLRLPDGYQ